MIKSDASERCMHNDLNISEIRDRKSLITQDQINIMNYLLNTKDIVNKALSWQQLSMKCNVNVNKRTVCCENSQLSQMH